MARSPIQPKKQDNKRSSEGGVGGDGEGVVGQNFKMGGVGNIRAGGLHKIEELITLRQLANNDRGIHKRYEKIAKRITLI